MRVEEAVGHMTKSYLHRVIDSFTRDLPKADEDRSRELIVRNVAELTSPSRVSAALSLNGSFAEQALLGGILEVLVNAEGHQLDDEAVFERLTSAQHDIIAAAQERDALRYEDSDNLRVFTAVLEVALEDDRISADELRLIRRLREKLRLTERAKFVTLARLRHYPTAGNALHTRSDVRDALTDLQKRGIVFYCNRLEGGRFIVPEEIVPQVREVMGIELSESAWRQLLLEMSQAHLATILAAADLPKSGTKNDQIDRLVHSGLKPSSCLDSLSNTDLYDICKALPGAKVSGSKEEKARRLIDYFATLVTKEVSAEASPGELYYEYLTELAARDRESLFANKVIRKDIDMERAFEEGTRFLVTEKLGLTLIEMAGSDHADGGVILPRSGDVLLWDNKSKESVYAFPEAHLKQFKRYIRDSQKRVSTFMVIAPEIDDASEGTALRLKVESGSDTDVSLITAEDLRWVAETWEKFSRAGRFDPEVFNHTGILTRRVLEQRMKLFLA